MPPTLKNRKPKRPAGASSSRPKSTPPSSSKQSTQAARSKLVAILGPLISLFVLLVLNSSYVDLPYILVSTPSYLSSLILPSTPPPLAPQLWELAPHPSGHSLIVSSELNHSLEAGTLLFSEPPLIVLPTSWKVSSIEAVGREIRKRVAELDKEDQAAFYALSELGGDAEETMGGESGREMRIVRTNSVRVGERMAGIFRVFPRINHSCQPNAHYVYRPATDRIYVHTTSSTPLPPTTELFVSYLDPFEPTSVRQSELLTRYGFECTCPRCSNAAESDPRSEEIRRLKKDVGGWVSGGVTGEEAVRMMRRVLELMETEGVEAGRGQTAMDLAKIGAGHKDEGFARKWAQQSQIWLSQEVGTDSDEALRMGRVATEPVSTWAEEMGWGRRETLKLQ